VSTPRTYAATVAAQTHAPPSSNRTSRTISGTVAAPMATFASSTTSEVLESGRGIRWTRVMKSVHKRFVYPSTLSPTFHTRPEPSARLRAYLMDIIASSTSHQ
jgi:hypothetical protein